MVDTLWIITDLIKVNHNSNYKTYQTTLKGKIIQEFTYYIMGFVPADVVPLKKDLWCNKLSNEQITALEKLLDHKTITA